MAWTRPPRSEPERDWWDRVYARRYAWEGSKDFQGGLKSDIEEAYISNAGNNGSARTERAQLRKNHGTSRDKVRPNPSCARAVCDDGTYLVSNGGRKTIKEVKMERQRMHGGKISDQGQYISSERAFQFAASLGKDGFASFLDLLYEQLKCLGVSQ